MVDELLAEGLSLVGVFDGFFVADAREADALDYYAHAFVVEICHEDCRVGSVPFSRSGVGVCLTLKALVLLAKQILHWNLHILECHVCSTTSPYTLAVHLSRADTTVFPLDEKGRDTVHTRSSGSDSRSKVVAPNTVGNPLLLAIDNVVLAILGKLGLARQVGDIAASVWFRYRKTYPLVPVQDLWQYPVDQGFLAEFDQWRAANAETPKQVPNQTTATGS